MILRVDFYRNVEKKKQFYRAERSGYYDQDGYRGAVVSFDQKDVPKMDREHFKSETCDLCTDGNRGGVSCQGMAWWMS